MSYSLKTKQVGRLLLPYQSLILPMIKEMNHNSEAHMKKKILQTLFPCMKPPNRNPLFKAAG